MTDRRGDLESQRMVNNRKSYQFRALSRKALAFQKRQGRVNFCCIFICPLSMVLISSILGSVVTHLITQSSTLEEYVYCSNVPAMDQNNFPLPKSSLPVVSATDIPNAATPSVTHANYYPPAIPTSAKSIAPFSSSYSCSNWFGPNYPYSPLYERNPQVANPLLTESCTYLPNPKGGWLSPNPETLTNLVLDQVYTWSYVAMSNNVSVGYKNKPPLIPNAQYLPLAMNMTSNKNGFLGTIPDLLYLFVNGSLQQLPYYVQVHGQQDTLDDMIAQTVNKLAQVDKSAILGKNADAEAKANYTTSVIDITMDMPIGAIYFNSIDAVQGEFDVLMQVGTDQRISNSATYPQLGTRLLVQYTQFISGIVGETLSNLTFKITSGLRHMPYLKSNALSISISSLLGEFLYPFGVSFLIPTFMMTMVKEKEERILVMMQMNGLKISYYYLSHYLHFYALYAISAIVFIISGVVAQMQFFTLTSPGVYLLLFFLWGHAQVALAFFLSSFFGKSRTALVSGVVIMIAGVNVNGAMTQISGSGSLPGGYILWPPFAFYRALSLINMASYTAGARPYTMGMLTGQDQVTGCLLALFFETFFYLFLAWYLSKVLKSEFGIQKPWHFIFTETWRRIMGKSVDRESGVQDFNGPIVSQATAEELEREDDDVKAERNRVMANQFNPKSPLVMKGMRKVYATGNKLAVRDITIAVEPDSIFGLLGPNGAGKTTLMSILSGIYPPSAGTALLSGFNINTEMNQVYRSMGICPQHDILWEELTVAEHLYFYARLKGIDKEHEDEEVQNSLKSVSLESYADRISKGLSGGEKRRLSIAIALIGNPYVVFLDEPTTGLDPEVRRLIWTIINKARTGRTIVLTTHSMEEAEAICQRIAIMAQGYLRCIGSLVRLKEKYGNGFKLKVCCQPEEHAKAAAFVESLLPQGWKSLDSFEGSISYEFIPQRGYLPQLFEKMEESKSAHGILDWGLSQTTLEEVFLKIVSDSEADSAA